MYDANKQYWKLSGVPPHASVEIIILKALLCLQSNCLSQVEGTVYRTMYQNVKNNDSSVGGSILWSRSPANTMISNHELSEEEKILQSRNLKLATRLGIRSGQSIASTCPSDIWKASREGNLEQLIHILEVL